MDGLIPKKLSNGSFLVHYHNFMVCQKKSFSWLQNCFNLEIFDAYSHRPVCKSALAHVIISWKIGVRQAIIIFILHDLFKFSDSETSCNIRELSHEKFSKQLVFVEFLEHTKTADCDYSRNYIPCTYPQRAKFPQKKHNFGKLTFYPNYQSHRTIVLYYMMSYMYDVNESENLKR